MSERDDARLATLRAVVEGYGPSLIAFSGGADSALVLKVAACTSSSEKYAPTSQCEW